MRFVNQLDARLLYGCGYYSGYEVICFTRCNLFTNYFDYFPQGRYIHMLRINEPAPPLAAHHGDAPGAAAA